MLDGGNGWELSNACVSFGFNKVRFGSSFKIN